MINEHIEIVGCAASGKTTLCNTLKELGWEAIYEPYRQNPFLEKIFMGDSCGFELQMCFLLQHFNEIRLKARGQNSICDFSLALDSIYTSLLLKEKEKKFYNDLYDYLVSIVGELRRLIKITCPDDVILNRARERNRNYESKIGKDFFINLNGAIKEVSIEVGCIELDLSKMDYSNPDVVKKYLLPLL